MHESIGHCVRVGEQKKEVTKQGWTRITKQTNKEFRLLDGKDLV